MHQEIFHKRIAYTSDSSYCYAPKKGLSEELHPTGELLF